MSELRDPRPPIFGLKLLRWFCPPQLLEEIEGDLLQRFKRDMRLFGERRAQRRFAWNTIRFFRPGIFLRNKLSANYPAMLAPSYFRFAWRNLGRHRLFSFINITGLVVGMTVCLMITNYVLFEQSYDAFHTRRQDIVRVSYSRFIDGEFQFSKAQVFPAIGEAVKNALPEVEEFVRIFPMATYVEPILSVETNDDKKTFVESALYVVDSSFLKVFSLSLLQGDPISALRGEKKILLSASAARKYFGEGEVLNKTIHWDGTGDWLVTGVFEDLPENSHMKFDFLASWMRLYGDRSEWNWDGFYTYLLLKPGTDRAKFQAAMQKTVEDKLKGTEYAKRLDAKFILQPLEDIHLYSQLNGEMQANGSAVIVKSLQAIALVILGLALINYLNLSLARAIKRGKEVGVRKIVGSSRRQLMGLFFTEAFTLNSLSLLLAVSASVLLTVVFNNLVGKPVELVIWRQPLATIAYCLLILLLISVLSGFYPARIMASVNPALGVKGAVLNASRSGLFRKFLLTTQFLITIVLVAGTFVVQRQIEHMQRQNLGFALNQNLVVKNTGASELDSSFVSRMRLFKEKIRQHKNIINATITSNIPGRENDWVGRLRRSEEDPEMISTTRTRVDLNFMNTYGLKLIAGRNFSSENAKQVILNQFAVKLLGFKNDQEALGSLLMRDHEIVGIVNDYHERSLQEQIGPSMFTVGTGYMKFTTVRICGGDMKGTVEFVEEQWHQVFPDKPLEYFFLDDFFNRQYQREQQIAAVFRYFSTIGIFIACLGLFGFVYFMTHQRTKEIGIRKTLGASAANLLILMSSEFGWLLLLAGVVAIPVSYFLSREWLTKYPFRMELNWQLFLLPMVLVAILAFASVAILLIRAIRSNPVDALKYE